MKVKVLRPISVGGAVFQKGDIVDISEDVAKAHGSEYCVEVSEEAEATAEAPKVEESSDEATPSKKKPAKKGKK